MGTRQLFCYGTLKERGVQEKEIGRVPTAKKDSVLGYRLEEIDIEGKTYPIAIEDANGDSRIEGVVLSLTGEELDKLDEYEGEDYRRIEIDLVSGEKAEIYVRRENDA